MHEHVWSNICTAYSVASLQHAARLRSYGVCHVPCCMPVRQFPCSVSPSTRGQALAITRRSESHRSVPTLALGYPYRRCHAPLVLKEAALLALLRTVRISATKTIRSFQIRSLRTPVYASRRHRMGWVGLGASCLRSLLSSLRMEISGSFALVREEEVDGLGRQG